MKMKKKAYPEIGKCLYMDLALGTHILLFEIPKNKINWVWFVNEAEPQFKVIPLHLFPSLFLAFTFYRLFCACDTFINIYHFKKFNVMCLILLFISKLSLLYFTLQKFLLFSYVYESM